MSRGKEGDSSFGEDEPTSSPRERLASRSLHCLWQVFFSFLEVFIVEPIVFPCKIGCNLSVRASVICRRERSVPGVWLKIAEVGPLLEPEVVRWIVTNIMFWERFAELVAKQQRSRQSVMDILFVLFQFSFRDVWDFQWMRIEKVFILLLPSPLELRRGVCTTCRRFLGCYLGALDVGRSHTHIYKSALLVKIRTASEKYSANSASPS